METIAWIVDYLASVKPWVRILIGSVSVSVVICLTGCLSIALEFLRLPFISKLVFATGIIVSGILFIITFGYACFFLLQPLLFP